MMTLFKLALALTVAAFGMLAIGTVSAGAYLFSGGIASVAVDTPDVDLRLPVPLRLVDLSLGVAGLATPSTEDLARELDLDREQLEQLRPMMRDLASEVATIPEGELVRVRTEDEDVRISQRGGRLRIDVQTPDAEVHVSFPRRAAGRILRSLAEI